MAATRRAWHASDETFRDRLLALVKKGGKAWRKRGSHSGKALAAHGTREAERLVAAGLLELGLRDEHVKVLPARKGDSRKAALATWRGRAPRLATNGSRAIWKWAMNAP